MSYNIDEIKAIIEDLHLTEDDLDDVEVLCACSNTCVVLKCVIG